MMKPPRIAKILVTGALAAVTVSGVGVQANAAQAQGVDAVESNSTATASLIVQGPQGAYFGFTGQNAPTGAAIAYVNTRLDPVMGAAVTAQVPAIGAQGEVRIAGDQCLAVAGRLITWQPCNDDVAQQWTVSSSGALQPSRGGIWASQSRPGPVPVSLGAVSAEWKLLASAPQPDFTVTGAFSEVTRANARVTGSAQPGAEVQVWIDGQQVAQSVAQQMSGTFVVEIPAPNAGGSFTYRVVEVPADGAGSHEAEVVLDFGAVVSVDDIARDSTGQGASVLVTGSGEPGGEISIALNGAAAAGVVARVNAAGRWEQRVQMPSSREVSVRVTQVARGNNSTTATTTIAPVPDAAPSELTVASPAQGATVATDPVPFSGLTTPGQRVELRSQVSGALLGRTFADSTGAWSVDVNQTLSNGDHTIQAVSGTASVERTFSVALTRQSSVQVETPTWDDATAAGVVVFSGTTTPNVSVVLRAQATGALLGAGMADGNGTWSVQVNKPLSPGSYVIGVVSEGITLRYAFRLIG